MKHIFTIFAVFLAALCSAQSANLVGTKIRAEESLRIGTTSSQKVTGFDLVMPGTPTHTKLPTSKCIYGWVTGSTVLIGGTAGGDLNGTWPNPTVDGLQGFPISSTTPIMGQVLKWTGSQWVPGTDDNTGNVYTAGTGISISGGNQISNTGDLSPTNEIQNLSLAGQALSISSGTGVTLPVVGVTAADFDLASGVLSLDYTNAQKATAVVPGFLTAADWGTFNAKLSTNVALGTGFTGGGGSGTIPTYTTTNTDLPNWGGDGSYGQMTFGQPSYYQSTADGFESFGMQIVDSVGLESSFIGWDAEDPSSIIMRSGTSILNLSSVSANFSSNQFSFIGNGSSSENTPIITFATQGIGKMLVKDDTGTKNGLEYFADYSADFTSRSLIDKGFVNSIAKKSNTITTTTDVGGELIITHSLGATPVVVVPSYVGNNPYTITVTAKGATTFTVKVWDSAGDAVGSTPVTIDWFAR